MKVVTQLFWLSCVAISIVLMSSNSVQACSCGNPGTVDKEFEHSPTVVILKLQAVERLAEGEKGYGYGGIKQSKLTVEKVFKGNLKIGQELPFAQGGGGDCIWTFDEDEIGKKFLFYLGANPVKNDLWAGFGCSRSGSAEYKTADLLYLEKMAKVKGKTRLSGTVVQSIETSVEDGESQNNRLGGRKINISGNGKNIELKTDENGVYETYDLPIGKYKVTPEKIDGYKFSSDVKNSNGSLEVAITSKSHVQADVDFEVDNGIGGKFFDTNGKPLKDVCLNLLPAHGKEVVNFYQADCTNESGAFKFNEIPAGTYVIVVNNDGKITSDEPFGTFYYPNVTKREDAAEITINAGDFRDDLVITAPQTAETITISGTLLFQNGKPKYDDSEDKYDYPSIEFVADRDKDQSEENKVEARAETDRNGNFSIRILKGQKGRLFALTSSYIGKYENCPKLDELIRTKGEDSVPTLQTPSVEINAVNDINGIELKFPFPKCKKAKIE